MAKIEWNQKAKDDLLAILEFIAEDNLVAAQTLKNHIEKVIFLLSKFPAMGRVGRVPMTREVVVNHHYILVYTHTASDVLIILRVLSTYLDWPSA